MEMKKRALYNTLRMNWVMTPTAEVEPWQVEDYRTMPLDGLFERLEDRDIRLDKSSFLAFADTVDSPEELAESILAGFSEEEKLHDQVYLILFELWRRLLPEKPSVSIFCDEIDHQIYLYDKGEIEDHEALEDALANLKVILDENVDEGADPHDAFSYVRSGCANDIESFLYDFISEQIENGNETYAAELIEGFAPYAEDEKWFEFLRARLIASTDPEEANAIVHQLLNEKSAKTDLEFHLEVLSFLVAHGDKEVFEVLVKRAVSMLEVEDDFQLLLSICVDFYHRIDREAIEKALQRILDQRDQRDLERPVDPKDPQITEFLKKISS